MGAWPRTNSPPIPPSGLDLQVVAGDTVILGEAGRDSRRDTAVGALASTIVIERTIGSGMAIVSGMLARRVRAGLQVRVRPDLDPRANVQAKQIKVSVAADLIGPVNDRMS
jgi:hypothetical protein